MRATLFFVSASLLSITTIVTDASAGYKECKQAREWYSSQRAKCQTDPTVDQSLCAGLVDAANELAYSACHEKRAIRQDVKPGPSDRRPVGKDAGASISAVGRNAAEGTGGAKASRTGNDAMLESKRIDARSENFGDRARMNSGPSSGGGLSEGASGLAASSRRGGAAIERENMMAPMRSETNRLR